MGVASMVLGIVFLVISIPVGLFFARPWYIGIFMSALIPSLVGLILGAAGIGVGKKKGKPVGCAVAGLVLNIISVAILITCYVLFVGMMRGSAI